MYRKDTIMDTSRNKSVDIARGIAMIAIVLGHLGLSGIDRVVYTFHIPIFYLITGYYSKTGENIGTVVKKRFRQLIVPYYLACVGVIVFACIFNNVGNEIYGIEDIPTLSVLIQKIYASLYGSGVTYTEPFIIIRIGAIWFLWATFWGTIFLSLIQKIKQAYRIFLVLGLFAAGYYTRSICWFPLSIQAGCCAAFYMYIGASIKEIKADYDRAPAEIKISLFIISLCAWINFIQQYQSFALVKCDIGRGPLDVIGSLCACYVLIIICKGIEKKTRFLSNGLQFLGRYSLIMLVAHIIELDTFPWALLTYQFALRGHGAITQYSVMIGGKFIWIIGVTVICAKTNWIRRLFGMKPLAKKE